MRHLWVFGTGLAFLSLSACGSCAGDEPEEVVEETEAVEEGVEEAPPEDQPEAPDGQSLSFSVQGGELDGKRFDVKVPDNIGYWLYDPKGKSTMISARGEDHDLDAYLYAAIPVNEPGVYEYRAGGAGADTRVQLRFRDAEAGESFALIAVEGKMELEAPVQDYLQGTFGGKFVYSKRLGADLKDIPEEKRQYVTIEDGRFAVSWKDRIGGNAQRWGNAPVVEAEPPTAATP
jgi:hypothetical protein